MLFYNEDWIHFVWVRYSAGIDVTEAELRKYIYSLKGTQVTDFVMNVNGTISMSDSKVLETFADKFLATEDNGMPVDYKNTYAAEAYKIIRERKIDMYRVWIEALNEVGIRPWISFRMNDCHGNMTDGADVRRSSAVNKYPENHIAAHRERRGYFDKCLDYSKPQVRKQMLDYIDEQLDRYDVYGVELDFMRDLFFVQFGREYGGTEVMSGFLKDVFSIIEKYEKKYKHYIKRSVLLSPEPNLTLERGMNIFEFTEEIDNIIIIPRWETTDTDMPIELWKQLLKGKNVALGGGQQLLFKPYRGYKPVTVSVKMAFGQAISNLSRGCDFVYLYNYMDMGEYEGVYDKWSKYNESIRNDENRPLIFNNIGSVETLLKQERSHVVTYNDFWRYDIPACSVLPVSFDGIDREYKQIKIPVGKVPQGATVKLYMGVSGNILPEDISVYINAEKCVFEDVVSIDSNIYENKCCVFSVGGEMYGIMYAEVNISKKSKIDYVEIRVHP